MTTELKPDNHVESVRLKLLERSQRGILKYGTTTEREDLTESQWLQHAQEEALDLAVYLERLLWNRREPQPASAHPEGAWVTAGHNHGVTELLPQPEQPASEPDQDAAVERVMHDALLLPLADQLEKAKVIEQLRADLAQARAERDQLHAESVILKRRLQAAIESCNATNSVSQELTLTAIKAESERDSYSRTCSELTIKLKENDDRISWLEQQREVEHQHAEDASTGYKEEIEKVFALRKEVTILTAERDKWKVTAKGFRDALETDYLAFCHINGDSKADNAELNKHAARTQKLLQSDYTQPGSRQLATLRQQVETLTAERDEMLRRIGANETAQLLTKAVEVQCQATLDAIAEREELQATFDLRWKADQRAIKLWQKQTGQTLVWPDHAELCCWLLKQLDAECATNAVMRQALEMIHDWCVQHCTASVILQITKQALTATPAFTLAEVRKDLEKLILRLRAMHDFPIDRPVNELSEIITAAAALLEKLPK